MNCKYFISGLCSAIIKICIIMIYIIPDISTLSYVQQIHTIQIGCITLCDFIPFPLFNTNRDHICLAIGVFTIYCSTFFTWIMILCEPYILVSMFVFSTIRLCTSEYVLQTKSIQSFV